MFLIPQTSPSATSYYRCLCFWIALTFPEKTSCLMGWAASAPFLYSSYLVQEVPVSRSGRSEYLLSSISSAVGSLICYLRILLFGLLLLDGLDRLVSAAPSPLPPRTNNHPQLSCFPGEAGMRMRTTLGFFIIYLLFICCGKKIILAGVASTFS